MYVGSVAITATCLKITSAGQTIVRVASVDNVATTGDAGGLVSPCKTSPFQPEEPRRREPLCLEIIQIKVVVVI